MWPGITGKEGLLMTKNSMIKDVWPYEKWKKKYDKFDEDYDKFRVYYEKNKKCKCDMNECNHFTLALVDVLGERLDEIFDQRLMLGAKTHMDAVYGDKR